MKTMLDIIWNYRAILRESYRKITFLAKQKKINKKCNTTRSSLVRIIQYFDRQSVCFIGIATTMILLTALNNVCHYLPQALSPFQYRWKYYVIFIYSNEANDSSSTFQVFNASYYFFWQLHLTKANCDVTMTFSIPWYWIGFTISVFSTFCVISR